MNNSIGSMSSIGGMRPNAGMQHIQQPSITEDDFVICDCGNTLYIQVTPLAKIKSNIIGQPPKFAQIAQLMQMVCSKCGKPISVESKTKKESNSGIEEAIIS